MVTLNIPERLATLGILPKNSSLVTMRIAQELSNELGFTSEEIEKNNIVQTELLVTWGSNFQREFDLSAPKLKIIKKALEKLDETESVEPQHVILFEKFNVRGKDE